MEMFFCWGSFRRISPKSAISLIWGRFLSAPLAPALSLRWDEKEENLETRDFWINIIQREKILFCKLAPSVAKKKAGS